MTLCVSVITGYAQNPSVQSALRSKFSLVQYHPECGGWYLVNYQQNGQTYYGFADNAGNIVGQNALKYKIHKGYIELYILDMEKKAAHDQWLQDKRQYEIDMQNYERVNAQYQAEKEAYDRKVQAARTEATRLWRNAQERAAQQAKAEAEAKNKAQQQQQGSGGGIWGAIATGLVQGINVGAAMATARNNIAFEPYFDQVKANRNLTVGPSEPYNPMPSLPSEPSSGFEWRNFSLLQPNPYSYIDFAKISEPGSFADVQKDGYWGLVDSNMKEVVPCTNSSKVLQEWFSSDRLLIKKNSGYGVIDKTGKVIVPCEYSSITKGGNKYMVRKDGKSGLLSTTGAVLVPCDFDDMKESNGYMLCKRNGMWGVYTTSFEELYPCQFQEANFATVNNKLMLNTKVKGLKGVIDFSNGQPLLPNKFLDISTIKLGDNNVGYLVNSGGKHGLYSSRGVIIMPCEFDNISTVTVGKVAMLAGYKNGNIGLYDLDGICFVEPKYKKLNRGNIYFITENAEGKKGACSYFGQEIIPCQYKSVTFDDGLGGFFVSDGSQMKMFTIAGDELFPFVPCTTMEAVNGAKGDYLVISNGGYKTYGACDFDGNVIVPTKNQRPKVADKVESYMKKNDILSAKNTKIGMLTAALQQYSAVVQQEVLKRNSFSFYAQNYVGRIINEWQRRGEFEKRDAYMARVNNETRQQKVYELTKEAQQDYIAKRKRKLSADVISIVGQYDADNETYRVKSSYSDKELLVHVPSNDAQEFKAQFDGLKKTPTFFIENDDLALAEYAFDMGGGKVYKYSNKASLTYSIAQVDYDFDAITIDQSASNNHFQGGKQTISTTNMNIGTSDVDVAIPQTSLVQDKTFAVIIANESYENEKKVDYAGNDGLMFREYCQKVMGIPAENIHFRSNATKNNILFEVDWIEKAAKAYNGDAKFIFYYAGHGMPDDASKEAYILPVDGFSSKLESGYKLSDLYETLSQIPSQSVMMFLDACFSGSARDGQTLASARGVAIRPNISTPKGNLVVFSAVSNNETAYPYKEKHHGLFTYFLLKKMKETDGTLQLGTLANYVKSNVSQTSIKANSKSQTPTVSPSQALLNSWQSLRIK